MIQRLECKECADRWRKQHSADPEGGEFILLVTGIVGSSVPANHGIGVTSYDKDGKEDTAFYPADSFCCDGCNASLDPGDAAVAVTLGNIVDIANIPLWWEDHFLVKPTDGKFTAELLK